MTVSLTERSTEEVDGASKCPSRCPSRQNKAYFDEISLIFVQNKPYFIKISLISPDSWQAIGVLTSLRWGSPVANF